MRTVTPEVHVLAATQLDFNALREYLRLTYGDQVAEDYEKKLESHTDGGLDLIEFLGRLCYRSFAPGLNANVTRVRLDQAKYFENIIQSGHGSILEHVAVTFLFKNVSRVFTHEIVRHRAGTAISQESLRYVRLDEDIPVVLPPEMWGWREGEVIQDCIRDTILEMEKLQRRLVDYFEIDKPGRSMQDKKGLTSGFRRLAPIGIATTIAWTANLRTLYHVIPLRTSPHAEWEIRKVFDTVASICQERYPHVFAGFKRQDDGSWVTDYPKV